jgi:hypothetical protein
LPVIFEAELGGCRLVLGSDGLFKQATAERICSLATGAPSPTPLMPWRTARAYRRANLKTTWLS